MTWLEKKCAYSTVATFGQNKCRSKPRHCLLPPESCLTLLTQCHNCYWIACMHASCRIIQMQINCMHAVHTLIGRFSLTGQLVELNAFVSGAWGLKFRSRTRQIGHSVANGMPLLQHFCQRNCIARAQWRVDRLRKFVTFFGVTQRVK